MSLPLLLEPEQLQQHLNDSDLLIVDLSSDEQYRLGHIPGAVHVSPKEIISGQPPAPGPPARRSNSWISCSHAWG